MAPPLSAIDIEHLEASQYMSAVGMVIMLWDHILTFPDEVQLIWRARWSIPKALFFFNRYMVPIAMVVQTHEFSGLVPYLSLTVSTCKAWYAMAVAVGMLSITTSNFLVLLRLWVLWDRSPRLMLSTLAFFIVTQILALSFAGYVIYEMLPTLLFNPLLRVCMPTSKPNFLMLWSPGIAFELMIFLTTVWNALDRPRSRNAQMAKIMYRDGSVYFFALFALRLLNMVLFTAAPASLTFLGVYFVWSFCNITLARLIFNLRRLSSNVGDEAEDDELKIDAEEGVECTELPVLRRECSGRSDPERQRKGML